MESKRLEDNVLLHVRFVCVPNEARNLWSISLHICVLCVPNRVRVLKSISLDMRLFCAGRVGCEAYIQSYLTYIGFCACRIVCETLEVNLT